MKRFPKLIITTVFAFLVMALSVSAFAMYSDSDEIITVYSGITPAEVHYSELEAYLDAGWTLNPVVTEGVTELPVTFTYTVYDNTRTIVLNEFDPYYMEYLDYENRIRIYYDADFPSTLSVPLAVKCYDSYGNFLEKVALKSFTDYIDVPGSTAMFDMVVDDYYSGSRSGEFRYAKKVNLYAMDGRMIRVFDIQAPVYETVGWYREVTMYALDGRTIVIPPHSVEAYKAVGWYEFDGYVYHTVKYIVDSISERGEYEQAIKTIEEYEDELYGTEYEYSMQLMKEQQMDKWRNRIGCPLGYIEYSLDEEYGVPTVEIWMRNISYKPIDAFRLKFDCYNVFGELEESYYDTFSCVDADMASGEALGAIWKLYGADSIHTVTNIRVTEVVFADGTKW